MPSSRRTWPRPASDGRDSAAVSRCGPTWIDPPSKEFSPLRQRKRVDLPPPLGPISATVSPARDGQVDAVQHLPVAVALAQVRHLDAHVPRTGRLDVGLDWIASLMQPLLDALPQRCSSQRDRNPSGTDMIRYSAAVTRPMST